MSSNPPEEITKETTEEIAISLRNISKCFKRYAHPADRLKELLLPSKSYAQEFWALQDINLDIPKGKTVGIIGRNGSGKSTLLQIIAGTLTPSSGSIQVKGRVSALLELGSGFNPEFTGRQNIFFNGRLLGLSRQQLEEKFDEIAAFADLGDFIDEPVKTYSSGMFVRLAFAVAVNVDPEVLIVDEALAVGDVVFQHRCMRKMRSLMDSGVTTLFVSHDSGAIKTLCNSAVMLHGGSIQRIGDPNVITSEYLKIMTELELGTSTEEDLFQDHTPSDTEEIVQSIPDDVTLPETVAVTTTTDFIDVNADDTLKRRGSGKARIEKIQLLNEANEAIQNKAIFRFNEQARLIVQMRAHEPLKSCILGFYICDKNGYEIIGSNSFEEGCPIGPIEQNETIEIEFEFRLPLRSNSYSLTVAGSEDYEGVTFDWIDDVVVFQVLPPDNGKRVHALVDQPMSVITRRNAVRGEALST